ncbi:MAG: HAD family hydrolase [Treponema sp.]|jgi:putative hydrolase of the HAD superfamily|nr:HAD family hydrolase [Treponema sp.]
MLQGISAVAFDLDGTLYPNYRLNLRLLPFLFRHCRFMLAFGRARDIIRQEQEALAARASLAIQPSSGIDFYERQAQLVAEQIKAQKEETRERIDQLIYRGWEPFFLKIKPFSHVKEVLGELKAAGLKLGLLSDFPPETKLEYLGLSGIWDTVLCTENIGALKPAVKPFEELAKAMGCRNGQILYVGNSRRYDVGGAKRAGMKAALLNIGFPVITGVKADFTFRSYRQLRHFMLQ